MSTLRSSAPARSAARSPAPWPARARVGEVRLIDPEGRVAEGKALDILQSSPVEQFNTRVTGTTAYAAAAGAT